MGAVKTVRAVDAIVVMIERLELGKKYFRREIYTVLREQYPFINENQLSNSLHQASHGLCAIFDIDETSERYNLFSLNEDKVHAFLLHNAKETPVPVGIVKHELERVVSYVNGLSVLDVGNKGTYDWLQSIGEEAKNTLDSFESVNF